MFKFYYIIVVKNIFNKLNIIKNNMKSENLKCEYCKKSINKVKYKDIDYFKNFCSIDCFICFYYQKNEK